jgi:hypothetical protein
MTLARVSPKWVIVPLLVWAVFAAIALVALFGQGAFLSSLNATARYDSGTRAAMAGDHARAVLELRRAQRVTPGLLPLAASLSARIDANLAEVRTRVASARVTPDPSLAGTSSSEAPGATTASTRSAITPEFAGRSLPDRMLAAVRAIPWGARATAAALLISLLVSLAAMRSLCVAAGARVRPGMTVVFAVGLLAILASAIALIDRVLDARRVEAVLLRQEVPRSGPDDLTYPPASAAAFPAGSEFLILAANEDGRWVRVVHVEALGTTRSLGSNPAGPMWLPRSAIERVENSDRDPLLNR